MSFGVYAAPKQACGVNATLWAGIGTVLHENERAAYALEEGGGGLRRRSVRFFYFLFIRTAFLFRTSLRGAD